VNAVVDVLEVHSGRLIPFSARPAVDPHLLIDGWVLRSHMTPGGARLITDVLLPGDLFAWQPAEFYDTATELRACGRAHVAVLRKDAVASPQSDPLSRCWERARDAEARALRSRLVSLGRRDARLRIAHLMAELHDRLHRAGLAEADGFECPLTQEQLADVLGLTSVHVNRVLQALRREGLLSFDRPRVSIPNPARLHAEAEYEGWPTESEGSDR
jgi:CRP-like cAMP-binding protein